MSNGLGGSETPSALPRYVQISETLIREIAAGHLADGSRLPPERQMAVEMEVSVGTLRKALDLLVDQKLLERIQGSGNYVRARQDVNSVYSMFRLENVQGGGLPTAQVLSVDRLLKPQDFPEFGASVEGFRIRRLRRLDKIPMAIEEIWLDGGYIETLNASDLSDSLYLFYRQQLGLVIGHAEDRIGVAIVPEWAPTEFDHDVGQAVGYIERVSWSQAGTRAEYSRTWFDYNKARYISRLGKG